MKDEAETLLTDAEITLELEEIWVRAAAFEAKYAVKDLNNNELVIDVPIAQAGVHTGNYGPYPQGLACRALLQNIVVDGVCQDEANSRGVAVRERPRKDMNDTYQTFLGTTSICATKTTSSPWPTQRTIPLTMAFSHIVTC